MSFCTLRFSKYIKELVHLKSIDEGLEYLRSLPTDAANRSVLLCASDVGMKLLDEHRDELKDKVELFSANNEQGRIGRFMDKLETFRLAEVAGLTLIKTWHVGATDPIPKDVVYPCIIKGNNSTTSSKDDMAICHSEEELKLKRNEGMDLLIQEFIEKEYEIDVNGLSINHGNNVLIPAVVRKVRESYGSQSNYIVLEKIPNGLEVEAVKRLVAAIGYEGLFSVEFMKKGDKFYFLEINLRNDGVNYLYTAGGVNMPMLWLKYKRGDLATLEGLDFDIKTPLYLMQESDIANLKRGRVPVLHWLRDFARTRAFFTMSLRDPMPFVYSMWCHARKLFKRSFN